MTLYSVSIDPDAQDKITHAVRWYDYQQPGLGEKFGDHIHHQIDSLRKNPGRHAVYNRNVRRMSMNTYPFQLHYTIDEDQKTVIVRDLIDTRRGPHHWPR